MYFVPFAGYENFDACVKANASKGDPKAYCATIMRQVEGKNMAENLFCKFASLDKSVSSSGVTRFKGVVSSTAVDYDNERMSKNALVGLQKDLMENTSVFFNHRYDGLAVAKTVKAWVEDQGEEAFLWAELEPTAASGPVDSTGVLVESIVQQMNEGTLKCLSVGGKKVKEYPDSTGKGVTVLDEVKGLEFSLVGIGANPDAMMKSFAKSAYVSSVEARLAKSRMESFDNDNLTSERSAHEEGEEKIEDRMPVVPPVTGKVKDKQKIKQELETDQMGALKTPFDAEYIKGGAGMEVDAQKHTCSCGNEHDEKKEVGKAASVYVAKENSPASGPNKPSLGDDVIEDVVRRVLARLHAPSGPVSGDSHSKTVSAEMPPHTEKSVKDEDKVSKFMDEMKAFMKSSPHGLGVQEEKFAQPADSTSDNKVNSTAVDQFGEMIQKQLAQEKE